MIRKFDDLFKTPHTFRRGELPGKTSVNWASYLIFSPAAMFFLLGVVVLAAPRLFLIALASTFFFVGAFLLVVAWKVRKIHGEIRELTQALEGKMRINTMTARQSNNQFDLDDDQPKIIFH